MFVGYKKEVVGLLMLDGANNLIAQLGITSKNCAGEVTNSFLVGIEKVDVFELAKQYPEAFARKVVEACGVCLDGWML